MSRIIFNNKLLPISPISSFVLPNYDPTRILDNPALVATLSDASRAVINFPTFYYSTNNFVLSIESFPAGTPADSSFMSVAEPVVVATTYWKFQDTFTDPNTVINNFVFFNMSVDIVTATPDRIECRIPSDQIAMLHSEMAIRGVPLPQFGMFVFQVRYTGDFATTYAVKISNDPIFSAVIPPFIAAPTADSYTTPGYTFECLYVPELTGRFVYNFFESNEEDAAAVRRSDYGGQNSRDIPRFNKLNWSRVPFEITSVGTVGVAARGAGGSVRVGGAVFSTSGAGPSAGTLLGGLDFGAIGDLAGSGDRSGEGVIGDVVTRVGVTGGTAIPMAVALGTQSSGYVGYVVIKDGFDLNSGEWVQEDFIIVANPNTTQLLDWKVVYGDVYRYRIRTLYKFVNRDSVSIYEDSDSTLTRSQELGVFGTVGLNDYLYFFDGDFSQEVIINCTEDIRPEFPTDFRLFPNSKNRNILLAWSQKNPNLDVIGFNVYKKTSNSNFRKVNMDPLQLRNNLFVDDSVEIDQEYIYAIEALDVHGNFSLLSLQMKAKIVNFDIDLGRNEELPEFWADAGKELIGADAAAANDSEFTFFRNKLKVMINPIFAEYESGKKFRIKFLSLDTLISKEIKVKFKLNTIYERGFTGRVAPEARSVDHDLGGTRLGDLGPGIVGGSGISI